MIIQLKKGKDGPLTLVCLRPDGSRTWSRLHPFFPAHDLTHLAAIRSLRDGLHGRWLALAPGQTLEIPFPVMPLTPAV